ncbi:hypothetical protein [Sodalis glossinidius]|nr:hypothetical protein [Sodalis glossinidius]
MGQLILAIQIKRFALLILAGDQATLGIIVVEFIVMTRVSEQGEIAKGIVIIAVALLILNYPADTVSFDGVGSPECVIPVSRLGAPRYPDTDN